jgi:hypothetical protein
MTTRLHHLVLFLLAALGGCGLTAAFPGGKGSGGGNHHKDGHDDNCVDISRYSDILYNTSTVDICSYSVERRCNKVTKPACTPVPVTKCEVKAYPDCSHTPATKIYHNDRLEQRSYTSKHCVPNGVKVLKETKQRPVCRNVTQQQCDSKWVINDLGEKVWDGNENCQDVTWEECSLEDYIFPIEVPVWKCEDDRVLSYPEPVFSTTEVTAYKTSCKVVANPVCTTTSSQECVSLEYEECYDLVEPRCQTGVAVQVPYQTFDHRLKCLFGNNH